MLLSKMIGAKVSCKSDPELNGSCVDFFIDTANGEIIYLLAHMIEDGRHQPALLLAKRVELTDRGIIFYDLGDVSKQIPVDMDAGPVDLSHLPPTVVGPFGYTFAPALIGAVFNDTVSGYAEIERPSIAPDDQQWHWYSHLTGLPVFDGATDLGVLSDIETRGQQIRCENLIVLKGGLYVGYPFWMLRDVAHGETNLKLETRRPEPWSAEGIAQSLDSAS